jgi:agmatinase
MPHVERIVHVGLRGLGSARASDVEDSRGSGNLLVTARQLRDRGMPWLLDQLPPDGAVFLSFDCDGLDPSVVPAVSAPSPGGLSYQDAVELLLGIGRRLAGAVFTEFVPDLDVNELGALTASRLISLTAQQARSSRS